MARKKYTDFEEWVEASGLSEEDLRNMERKLRRRTVVWFFLGFTVLLLPFLVETWAWYKRIKQRTFDPKLGFLLTLCALVMFLYMGATLISLLTVRTLPLLIITLIMWLSWFIARWTGFGTGIKYK